MCRHRSERRRGACWLALVVAALVATLTPVVVDREPAAAAEPDADLLSALGRIGAISTWYEHSNVSARLALVSVSGNGSEDARNTVIAIATDLADSRAEAQFLAGTLTNRLDRVEALGRQVGRLDEQIGSNQRELDSVRLALQQQAVERYVLGETPGVPLATSVTIATGEQARAVAFEAVADDLISRKRDLDARLADLRERLAETLDERDATQIEVEELTGQIGELSNHLAQLEQALPGAIDTAHERRKLATVNGLGLPLVVLDAYVQAADGQAGETPWCAIRWQLVGGIAMVESKHGTYQGNAVQASGRTTGTILGPLLDGSLEGTAVIGDTDGGAYDGNSTFDRAIGPFQFIPGTWRMFAKDGNGDGVSDPHNLYDAARAAASYLCHHSSLASAGDVNASIRAYNDSAEYVRQVLGFAGGYDAFAVPAVPLPS